VSDFLHARGFLYGIQFVMEDCILAMALFVSLTVAGIQDSHYRLVFETMDGTQGFGMVGVR